MPFLPKGARFVAASCLLSSLGVLSVNAYSYNCSGLNQYSNGASYQNGAKVKNAGKAFQCKVGGWCSIGGAYEPGRGWAAGEAWTDLGSCNGSGGGSSSSGGGGSTSSSGGGSSSSSSGGGSCQAWQAGKFYNVGDKVSYQGGTYVAEHENPGYDPIISTWFWEPSSGCGGGGSSSSSGGGSSSSSGGGGSCPAWQAGQFYNVGDKVTYQGGAYVAEHENPGYDPIISTWFWNPTSGCGGGGSSSSSSGGGSSSSSSGGGGNSNYFMTASQFNNLFPGRNGLYSYQGFVEAARSFPAFGTTGDTNTRKREVAAALANFQHETGNFVYAREIARGDYRDNSWGGGPECHAAPGQKYFGRGPIQLSWNGNYCAASKYIFGNASTLVNNPELVATDSKVAWQSALWFWMTQSGAGPQPSHSAITGGAGFGGTIRSINGALECDGKLPAKVNSRINNYNRILQVIGGSDNGNKRC